MRPKIWTLRNLLFFGGDDILLYIFWWADELHLFFIILFFFPDFGWPNYEPIWSHFPMASCCAAKAGWSSVETQRESDGRFHGRGPEEGLFANKVNTQETQFKRCICLHLESLGGRCRKLYMQLLQMMVIARESPWILPQNQFCWHQKKFSQNDYSCLTFFFQGKNKPLEAGDCPNIVDGSEIPNNHLECIKPCTS